MYECGLTVETRLSLILKFCTELLAETIQPILPLPEGGVRYYDIILLLYTHLLSDIRLTFSGQYDASHLLSLADQPLLGERITNCVPLVIFSGKVAADMKCTCLVLCKGFHQWAIGSVIIVLPHSAIDSDSTDIYLHENLRDYYLKTWLNSTTLFK